ncbi:ribokinase [Paenibacillus thiaminolyticus]|uniref:Ribokinase n=1 Tax=Paenibacillus thiaminolyticus TaxID=49283 RepID=A0AAP9DW71_PANTH|nr:ribokinase [Paenibacillus thiaminolyticus]MCY9538408.1 ribokinase [Paenibacillus thiaminolyticus]MCY9600181.1 ribokinase [Paenibacillus thiaminolyticus]MCY9608547.1 ribokinase [Paenibacillus thiaminolyticus]MCY9615160.1 ribokinase [Paenibacillus thiaminolyticus]MCY9620631.1 ribokinase [Paenibacillus thiaminolyticus]
MNHICVVGSLNRDTSHLLARLPMVGETVHGISTSSSAGGKGCNQAVSAARLGAKVAFIGKVGEDKAGDQLLTVLKEEQIDTSHIDVDPKVHSGEATILIQEDGKNAIIVTPGANMNIREEDIERAYSAIDKADIVIAQFEIPIPAVTQAFVYAKQQGKVTVLNPAPAKVIPEELLRATDILVPNESEMQIITGVEPSSDDAIRQAADRLLGYGIRYVIVTLGEQGALICHADGAAHVPAKRVTAVDTTAAGDSFIGALCSRLDLTQWQDVRHMEDIVRFANSFSALVVQRKGAISSIPYAHELESLQEKL